MAKSRNRSRDARKRAAKKRKNREYQERKREEISKIAESMPERMSPSEIPLYHQNEEE